MRVKYFLLRSHALEKIVGVARHREIVVVTAVVRFLRSCIGTKDDFYSRNIVKSDMLAPIIERFVGNGKRNNLLHSSILELLEFVRRDGPLVLLTHVWEKYETVLKSAMDKSRYDLFQMRYDQMQVVPTRRDPLSSRGGKGVGGDEARYHLLGSGGSASGSREVLREVLPGHDDGGGGLMHGAAGIKGFGLGSAFAHEPLRARGRAG